MSLDVDVSSADSIKKALTEMISKYGKPPSIVVNSAGITKDNFLLKMSEQDFDDVISVNLKVRKMLKFVTGLFNERSLHRERF